MFSNIEADSKLKVRHMWSSTFTAALPLAPEIYEKSSIHSNALAPQAPSEAQGKSVGEIVISWNTELESRTVSLR